MGMENKTNLIIAVNGYKVVNREKNASFTDIAALDNLNKKVLLRIIEPLGNECIVASDVLKMAELIDHDHFDSGFLISKRFTDSAVNETLKQKIKYVSDNYMPAFDIEKLYLAIVGCANNQCQKKCGKVQLVISDCSEKKVSDYCKTKALVARAKCHFEQGAVGLLKNDLMTALALSK